MLFRSKESRKQAPTLSSTTAPGGATREGQSVDKYEAEQQAKLAEFDALAAQAGIGATP